MGNAPVFYVGKRIFDEKCSYENIKINAGI